MTLPPEQIDKQEPALPEPTRSAGRASPLAAFLAALQFLLLSPAFIRRIFTDREMGASVGFYPLVGALLGGLLALLDLLLAPLFSLPVRSVLVLSAWVILTGALHLDGFLDAADGLLGGFTPERRLDIMRDERRGAYALAGGTLLLLLQYSALNGLGIFRLPALLLAPILGRAAISLALIGFPYARASGLGKAIKDNAGKSQAVLALATALAALIWLVWRFGLWAAIAAGVTALIIWFGTIRFTLKRIPGLTGDIYGTICILVETGVLLALNMVAGLYG
jgi:adenosylcobinamide-GDP ribazoletransferase